MTSFLCIKIKTFEGLISDLNYKIISSINSDLSTFMIFKTFSLETELIANKITMIDVTIDLIEGYTPICLNFCVFSGHTIGGYLNLFNNIVRGTVIADVSGTYPIRATIMYKKV